MVEHIRKYKRNDNWENYAALVLVAGHVSLYIPAICDSVRIPARGVAAVAVMCVALLAGVGIQYFVDRRVLRACDDMIDHLKDRS